MTRKLFIFVAVLSAMTFLGCKKSQEAKSDVITIGFWESEDAIIAPYLDSIITAFEKANPSVKVTRTHYAVEDLHTQFQSASIAGSPPDVLLTASDKAGLFVSSGLIMPLNGHFDFSQYVDNAVDATIQDGKTWGVPNNYGNQLMLYYNTDYIKNPPQTTNELMKLCEQLIKTKSKTSPGKNITCLEIDQNEPFWLVPVLTSFGGWPIDGHTPNLDTDAMVKSLEFIKDLKKKGYISQECDYNCMDSMYKEGNTAMIINGDWTIGAYLESMKGKMKITTLPVNSATGIRMRPMVSGKYFFISSFIKPETLESVKKFITVMNSAENQNRMKNELKKLPALKSVFDSGQIKRDPIFSVMAKQIEYGEAMPSVVEMRAVWDIVRQYQGLVLSGKMDSGTAAKRMQEEVLKRIKEMKM
jgi:arabinogalactan oligomer / maltooligosaccharide transport system substrate-binding protein